MIFPKFLKEGSTITIFAPSAGIDVNKDDSLEISINRFQQQGFKVKETASVRTGLLESADPKTRAKEFHQALEDPETDALICACGGDFLLPMLNYIDPEIIMKNPKWIQGYSDPTHLLFPITTNLEIATIYGSNGSGFDSPVIGNTEKYAFSYLKGDFVPQYSFDEYYDKKFGEEPSDPEAHPVYWKTLNGERFIERGRLIGGCMDCLVNLIGTRFDGTPYFTEKYSDDGFIWYFDIFSMSAETVMTSLWHMKECGWFKNVRGVVFGRILFPSEAFVSYEDAVIKILGDIPVIFGADVGHVYPRMTFINGAPASIDCKDGKAVMITEIR